ncbi:MAG: protein kinase [Planctomycetes bacterium]|nr:protein kinase [Planctomycetota bacterium]
MIFKAAIKIEAPAERAAFVRQACGSDGDLLVRLETLLRAHEEAGDFLETPPFGSGVVPDFSPVAEGPGTVIGHYKLLEKIGEGGMAVVYMAEQTEPIRRKVALKIIKPGMDTRQVIARFEAERQALALMDHPCIAKVLDAGATETGRPYFVMELVQGVSITEYCDTNSLSTKDRLSLFLQVCHAVQHAHQKGIIHRDIKPSNVMVTHHDGKPVPKVIDFGIAKATNQRLTEKTLFTRYAHLIGTPAYMSPEQAELSDLDIDTRSDIYSLGVLLYELLTGTTPFSEEELRKAGYLEMQRVIREQEPVKPSTRIRTTQLRGGGILPLRVAGILPALRGRPRTEGPLRVRLDTEESKAKMASGRKGGTPSPRLPGHRPVYEQVRGDLDWIVMKSLEKDRARRYETASGLAEDIRRHLEHEPILARGPGTAYRLQKLLHKHRVKVLSGSLFAVSLVVVAVVLFLWNQAQLKLAQTQHKEILSQAREQHAKGDRQGALETIQSIFHSRHVGPEAQLLAAGILAEDRRSDEAVAILGRLTRERPEIAGPAHSLWARILWENGPLDTERLNEIEEHRRQAKRLRPESAEAYFSGAMTALTVKEQLAALDKALQLDPEHYESLRQRAFTYYASRKYDHVREDARVMTILRRRDPLGHSLRAMALRELGKYQEAIEEYDSAISLTPRKDPQYVDLCAQRNDVFLRMGDYHRVMAEAREYLKLSSDHPIFQYHLFYALTALGDYEKAEAVFRQIIHPGQESHLRFEDWRGKYVFDTLAAGRSWHPPGREPAGAAFLPMREAEETYRSLSAKARCVIRDSFGARWSPDGKKLAFSLGVQGYSGVALFDPATKETDLLIVPGKDPRWSPDGRFIAFVRDCQALRLEELATAERRNQDHAVADNEVWIMKADGTEPRCLARGGCPSWGQDSTCVYYQSRVDQTFNSISIVDRDATPRQIMTCRYPFPSVSPDSRRVVYQEGGFLRVKDLASQGLVAEWPMPNVMSTPGWSPTGEELCVGMYGGVWNTTGLWICRFDRREPVKVLGGSPLRIRPDSWAADGRTLVFHLAPPYFETWTADLDPKVSTIEALAPGQTPEEHWHDMVRLSTRRIEMDLLDADAYLDRAQCYDRLHERAKADVDKRRWSALTNHGLSSDFRLDRPWTLVGAVNGPLGHQLVVFVERQEEGVQRLRLAFGQRGRCEMKMFEIPMVVTSLVGLCFFTGLDTPPAHTDFMFGAPVNLGPVVNTSSGESLPAISSDGCVMYFRSDRPGGSGGMDIYVTTRQSKDDDWGPAGNLGPTVNSSSKDYPCWISADGLSLYLGSDRPGGYGGTDIYVTARAAPDAPWGTPVNLGPTINSSGSDSYPTISPDGLSLYFASTRPGGFGSYDLWVATRATVSAPWGPPANMGPAVNSLNTEFRPSISSDGLVLFFSSGPASGAGPDDIYITRRANISDAWGPRINLGSPVSTSADDFGPCISADGSTLYWTSNRPEGCGSADIWQVPIIPILDFNGDGKVDAKDLDLLMADRGKSNSVCDIGPFPWGDGVVDEKDLGVLMKSLVTPSPSATDVSCDAVLSWTLPTSTPACDVYFGTSQEAVNAASRANPQGVLAIQGQTATTYDPVGLLDLSRTYYWRVDFMIPGPTPTIKGPVLQFTTAALTYPIKNVTAKASSAQAGSGWERTVDGSGLDKNDGHSTDQKDMWWSTGASLNWIQYEFDRIYPLHEMWVWNFNSTLEPFMGFGARMVKIEYSTDGAAWTALANVPEFARASGKAGYTANTIVSFAAVPAKLVKLTVETNWGGKAPQTGLSEVRFFCIQSAAVKR